MLTLRNTGSQQPLRRGRIARVVSAIGTAALVGSMAVLAGCSDAPSAPSASVTPSLSLVPSLTATVNGLVRDVPLPVATVSALVRDVPLQSSVTRSWTIRRATGGTIEWPELGLKVAVPSYAFPGAEMTITVTALAGDVVAYDFGPDGTVFDQPLVVTQDLRGTNWFRVDNKRTLRGAYFKHAAQVDDLTNTAIVNEFQESQVDVYGAKIRFKVTHFSGYMVSMD